MAKRQLPDLPSNVEPLGSDVYHTRQGVTDKKLTGDDLKQFISGDTREAINFSVETTGQIANIVQEEQLAETMAHYGSGGASYFIEDATSAANAYVIKPIQIAIRDRKAPAALFDQQQIEFTPSNDNTDLSTVDVSLLLGETLGTTILTIALDVAGTLGVSPGDIKAGTKVNLLYIAATGKVLLANPQATTPFGLGGNAAFIDGNDIDALNQTGFFIVTSSTTGTKPAGAGDAGSVIHIERGSSNQATQIFDTLIPGLVSVPYIRTKNNGGVWSAWQLIWHSGNVLESLSSNGFLQLPNGLIIQWATGTADPTPAGFFNVYPIAFPTTAVCNIGIHSGGDPSVNIASGTATTTGVYFVGSFPGNVPIQYIAIGY